MAPDYPCPPSCHLLPSETPSPGPVSCLSPCSRPPQAAYLSPLHWSFHTHFSYFKSRMSVENLGYLPVLENGFITLHPLSMLSLVLSLNSCRERVLHFAPVFLLSLCAERGCQATPADGLRALQLNHISCHREGGKNVWTSPCVWLHWFPKQSGSQDGEWHDSMSWHLHCHSTFSLGGPSCQVRCPGILPGWVAWSQQWWGCYGSSWRKPCPCLVPAGVLTHQCLPRPVGPQPSFAEVPLPGGPACSSTSLAHLTVFEFPHSPSCGARFTGGPWSCSPAACTLLLRLPMACLPTPGRRRPVSVEVFMSMCCLLIESLDSYCTLQRERPDSQG